MAQPRAIGDYLSGEALAALRGAYDRAVVTAALGARLPAVHAPATDYTRAVTQAFYETPAGTSLSSRDRERCLVALLAARGEDFTLALHIYVALMEGIAPEEVADVLFLVGVYSGASHFARGLLVEEKTLDVLARAVAEGASLDARSVLPRIAEAFGITL